MNEKCKEQVAHARMFGTLNCMRAAKRDGFCTQHHPDAVQARQIKASARYNAKWRARTRRRMMVGVANFASFVEDDAVSGTLSTFIDTFRRLKTEWEAQL